MGVMVGELTGAVSGVPAMVTTAQAGNDGALRMHSGTGSSSPVIGSAAHNSIVQVQSGPVGTEGFYGITNAQGQFGYASGKYLSLQGAAAPLVAPAVDPPEVPNPTPAPDTPPGAPALIVNQGVTGKVIGMVAAGVLVVVGSVVALAKKKKKR